MAEPSDQHPLTRWYIDTRPLTSTIMTLPLLETLLPADQETVQRFYHLRDRHMSLASYLLKYLFIHRACRIPWSDVKISRTAAPHNRPCFIPSASNTSVPAIEFNVSHQASLVALAGTTIPSPSPPSLSLSPSPSTNPSSTPQVGIDITCVNERRNTRSQPPPSISDFTSFVDIFAEVFSARELSTIKSLHGIPPHRTTTDAKKAEYGYRLFYTYWALKEAYIKMTGEALLAPWLRQLEFTDVTVLEPAVGQGQGGGDACWNGPYTGVKTWLDGKRVEGVRVEVLAFQEDYLIATAARGGSIGVGGGEGRWLEMKEIEIERDVRDCAMGRCACL